MRSDVDYRVIDVDDMSSLLFLTGNHRAFFISPDLGRRLRDGLDKMTEGERDEWEQLSDRGLISQENPASLLASSFQDGANLAINVNLTNLCNLNCTYCFASGGDYGRITAAMGHGSIDHIFAFIHKHVTDSREVRFEFFGGEPLANFPVMSEICERSQQVAREEKITFHYRVSTNLTLLPTNCLDLFASYGFTVSVSLDGGRAVQDANRPTKSGKGSFDRIVGNARRVREASDDIVLVARMTVAQREPSLLESVTELWDLNIFDYFQIYPAVFPLETASNGLLQIGKKPTYVNFFLQDGMVNQLRDFFWHYPQLFAAGNRFKGVLEYERTAQMIDEGLLALAFCSGGRTYFTHSPDTSITSCHRLVGDSSFDVGQGPVGLTKTPDDWRGSVDSHPVCGRCWARYVCGGGCKQENYVATGEIAMLNDESCRYQLLLTEEVLRMMARSSEEYRSADRAALKHLFVSCGRPVVDNQRVALDGSLLELDYTHFVPMTRR